MKKTMAYILAAVLALSVLTGCGEGLKNPKPTASPQPSPSGSPVPSMTPENLTPDPEDGVVKDKDGVITDDDSGSKQEKDKTGGAGNGTDSGKKG